MGAIKEFFKSFMGDMDVENYQPEPISNPTVGCDFNRFSDLLPYSAWMPQERLFVLEGVEPGSCEGLGFCLEVQAQTGATPEMADLLATMFTYFPAGTGIQVTLLGTPLIDGFLGAYINERLKPEEAETEEERNRRELYLSLSKRLADHYVKGSTTPLVPNTPYLLRNIRIVFSVVVPAKTYEDQDLLREVQSLRETCITTLKTYYQFKSEMGPEELINWCAIVCNPHETLLKRHAPHLNYDDGRPIKNQIVTPTTVMRITDEGVLYGLPQHRNEILARCMSVRSYPRACTLNAMGSIIGDYMQPALGYTCPFMITLGIVTQDFDETRNITQMKSARATQKADSPMAKFMPELADIKHDWDIAQRAFDDGTGTVKMFHQLVLYATPEEMPKAVQSAQAVWRAKQFEIVDDTYMQVQGLLASMPMALTKSFQSDLKIAQRTTTKTVPNAINMAPLLGEWSGVGRPIVPLWGRRGQAMCIDLFSNITGNFNSIIVGTSGSGKSVLMNLMALSYLSVGGRVWIIDIGRSFEKLCHSVPGSQYIEFTPDADIRLNPFSMVEDIDEDLEMLIPLFEQMCSPTRQLEDYERRQLGIHIQSVWYEKGIHATVDDLAYSLINNCEKGGPNPQAYDEDWVTQVRGMSRAERAEICDPRIRDLGVQLYPYTADGPYAKYFQGEANIDFNSDFIVLELEELAAKKDLQAVVMFLLMYRITQSMYLLGRDKPKLCLFDEAWQLLSGGNSSDFIESGYRRARKYGGSFCAATQSISDFELSRAAQAAMNNADWMFLLRQKPESVLALEKSDKLVLDEHTKKMLLSVKTVGGSYAEVFVHAGQLGTGIGRIIFDPYNLLMVSSKAEDFEAVRHYRKLGFSPQESLEAVLADRGVPGYTHPGRPAVH